jgi:hypothetical protein
MPGNMRELLDVMEAATDRDDALRLTSSRSGVALIWSARCPTVRAVL